MAKKAKSIYSVHPGVEMVQDWVKSLKPKTGRSLEEWLRFIKKEGPATEEERRDWLKKRHELGTNTAWWLAERSVGRGGEDDSPEAYLSAAHQWVEDMYAGRRAPLRPLHDRLIERGRKLGADVRICPCKTIVPLYRSHVFAQIKPATNSSIHLGFALGPLIKAGKKIPDRLEDTGGFKKRDRITHRIVIAGERDIDRGVDDWLERAYELDTPGDK